jgi:hypothetical protein
MTRAAALWAQSAISRTRWAALCRPAIPGCRNGTIAALVNLAVAAAGQPTDVLVTVARAAFDVEMDDRPV